MQRPVQVVAHVAGGVAGDVWQAPLLGVVAVDQLGALEEVFIGRAGVATNGDARNVSPAAFGTERVGRCQRAPPGSRCVAVILLHLAARLRWRRGSNRWADKAGGSWRIARQDALELAGMLARVHRAPLGQRIILARQEDAD